jgi:hypothetical protein
MKLGAFLGVVAGLAGVGLLVALASKDGPAGGGLRPSIELVSLAHGPPEIPSPRGALVPFVWAELPTQSGGQS